MYARGRGSGRGTGRGRGRGGRTYNSPSKAATKGKFIDGTWHCGCDPRLRAEYLQTKKGGPNHGRWFYTCQKLQHRQCGFFLWDDAAKELENRVVLNNSRSEIDERSTTPTPMRRQEPPMESNQSPLKRPNSAGSDKTLEETYGWVSSDEDVFTKAQPAAIPMNPETPRKTPRTTRFSSPGKSAQLPAEREAWTGTSAKNIFDTPKTGRSKTGLLSPDITPATNRVKDMYVTTEDLTTEVLDLLSPVKLKPDIENQLVEILKKHELRYQGAVKGREISRLAIQTKEKQIEELQTRIEGLEGEKETNKLVIGQLKKDINTAFSKKKRN